LRKISGEGLRGGGIRDFHPLLSPNSTNRSLDSSSLSHRIHIRDSFRLFITRLRMLKVRVGISLIRDQDHRIPRLTDLEGQFQQDRDREGIKLREMPIRTVLW
jgi:hypothetical protein